MPLSRACNDAKRKCRVVNVLPLFRKNGIASRFLELAEEKAREKSSLIGIGVGLYSDYGAAQILYIKKGFVPNGLGVTYKYKDIKAGNMVCVDDDLILWMTKNFEV